jgi:hypothetical protein
MNPGRNLGIARGIARALYDLGVKTSVTLSFMEEFTQANTREMHILLL